jgi:hypothetical protein
MGEECREQRGGGAENHYLTTMCSRTKEGEVFRHIWRK